MGVTYTAMRAMQFASLITVIGLVSYFINEITTASRAPPSELVGTLTVAVTAVIYVVITYILYYDTMLPLLLTAILDGLLLIASIVVASLLGKPLSSLNCAPIPVADRDDLTRFWATATYPIPNAVVLTKTLPYTTFVAVDGTTCYQIKAVWGFSIALCVLFAFSSLVCVGLWHRINQQASNRKDIEG